MAGGKLTAVRVKALLKPGRYGDGGGLHLHVRDAARRAWVLRYTHAGRTRDMGLGPFPEVSLAEARRYAEAARTLLREGRDPVGTRRGAAKAQARAAEDTAQRTFRRAAEDLVAGKEGGWRNHKHRTQWRATLDTYAYPVLGDLPVAAVDTEAVLRVLRPVWQTKPETASRLRGRIEAVLDAARVRGWREGENPARWKGHLAALLPPARKAAQVRHYPALPWQRIGDFVAELRAQGGTAARALEFAVLTAARTGEVRGARWREIDLDAAVWMVPAGRMKAGREHRVPLSAPALALLRRMAPMGVGPDSFVFPSDVTRGRRAGKRAPGPLSDMALSMLLRRMNEAGDRGGEPRLAGAPPRWCDARGEPVVPHGFRSTFRDWAEDSGTFAGRLAEAALAHVVRDKTEAAYQRGDLFMRRVHMMAAWGALCDRSTGTASPTLSSFATHPGGDAASARA